MPAKQRRRIKRKTFAKLRNKRTKERSELIDSIDGNPIFTSEDFEDDRIAKLLQQKQDSNYADDEERAIFLTDLLDADEDDEDGQNITQNDDQQHQDMLENIFGSQAAQQPTIMGSQLSARPLDINANANDLQYLMRRSKNQKISNLNLTQQLNELDDEQFQAERVSMSDMMQSLKVPIGKSAAKQIDTFDDNQELQRLKLTAQTKITNLNLGRKERGLQMDRTRKEMQTWSQAVTVKKEKLKHRRNMVPPRNNMTSFMENMEWNGDLGKELQVILDDYSKEHDLDTALKRHKPSKEEVVKQSKKMASMRRQIANQIKDFKRIKKVKSRSFRKRLRARKAKISPSLEELQEIDPRLYRREVKKLLRQRAEERMTLRHKNTSKWAMNIVRRGKDGKMDINSRKSLMEQLQRGKELKRRIKGMNSDDDESDEDMNELKSKESNTKAFVTEVESEQKKKEEYIAEAQDKGIWNMKFMKQAEDKRRADIKSLTESATRAQTFKDLDKLEKCVNNIEKGAYSVKSMVIAEDDPIGAAKHAGWLKRQERRKEHQIYQAQTILGKRKFGFSKTTNTIDMEPERKKMKHKVLDLGEKAKIVEGTQGIEESVFGQGTKSVMRVDVEDEDKGSVVTKDSLQNKTAIEPVFKMVEFPKHNPRKKTIAEINKEASKAVDRKDIKEMNTGKAHRIKHLRFYLHDIEQKEEAEDNDGWSVILDGSQSVHSVSFGTLSDADKKVKQKKSNNKQAAKPKIEQKKKVKQKTNDTKKVAKPKIEQKKKAIQKKNDTKKAAKPKIEPKKKAIQKKNSTKKAAKPKIKNIVEVQVVANEDNEDLAAFLSESEDDEMGENNDVDVDKAKNTNNNNNNNNNDDDAKEIKSILKRSKCESAAKDNNKRIKWTSNEYSDGNPRTKYHGDNKPKTTNMNPWLKELNGKKKAKKESTQTANKSKKNKAQKETTKFDPNKMLIPKTLRKTPDFNLLNSSDPKQLENIYNALNESSDTKYASFSTNDNTYEEFKKLKAKTIEDAMPNAIEGPLKGWDHWTGFGIEDDGAMRDDEYLQAKALYEKKKQQLLEKRKDGGMRNVILSDQVSKPSSKYLLKWQPDWVNIGMYKTRMKATLGREWNLSTEFFDTIKPEYDIPSGYIIKPTQKEDDDDNHMRHKTTFGKPPKKNKKQAKLQSVYKGNAFNIRRPKRNNERPQRGKI